MYTRLVVKFGPLGINLTHKSNTAAKTFDCVFAWERPGLGRWPHKNFGLRSSKENAKLLAISICCMHSHSQGFKGYCETTRIIPVIPREPGWYQEKVLRCCTLFFTSLFTFYDVRFHHCVSHGPFSTGVSAASSILEADWGRTWYY